MRLEFLSISCRWGASVLWAIVLVAPGCSTSEGTSGSAGEPGSSATFTTSVAGNKSIGSLSAGDRSSLCEDQTKFGSIPSLKADGCRFGAAISASIKAGISSGTTDAELRVMCSDSYDACMNRPPSVGNDANDDPSAGCHGPPQGTCTATVSELAACLEDTAAALHAIAGLFPDCASLSAGGGAPASSASAALNLDTLQPKSCDTLRLKCPRNYG